MNRELALFVAVVVITAVGGGHFSDTRNTSVSQRASVGHERCSSSLPNISASIFGIYPGQSQEALRYLVPSVYEANKRGDGLESWNLVGSNRAARPYNIKFVDGVVSQVAGKCLLVNDSVFSHKATKSDVFSEIQNLREIGTGHWSFESGNVELRILFEDRIGNDYLLRDTKREREWGDRIRYQEDVQDVRPARAWFCPPRNDNF